MKSISDHIKDLDAPEPKEPNSKYVSKELFWMIVQAILLANFLTAVAGGLLGALVYVVAIMIKG